MVGLHNLKHTCDLSDEKTVARWVKPPYRQHSWGLWQDLIFGYDLPASKYQSLRRFFRADYVTLQPLASVEAPQHA